MDPKTLDHVAFWLADREPIAETLTSRFGMHVIDRQDNFTLVGADARRGKLTLFSAEGPREQGAFKHVALRVSTLPAGVPGEIDLGQGVRLQLVETPTDSEYDLDHVALYSAEPAETAEAYERTSALGQRLADGIGQVAADAQDQRGTRRHPRLASEQHVQQGEADDRDEDRDAEQREEDGDSTTSHNKPH